MSASQTRRKNNGSIPVIISKDRMLKFINNDLSSTASNQINSLVRRRDFTKKYQLYNDKIKEIFLDELKMRGYGVI